MRVLDLSLHAFHFFVRFRQRDDELTDAEHDKALIES